MNKALSGEKQLQYSAICGIVLCLIDIGGAMKKYRRTFIEKIFWGAFIAALPVVVLLRSHQLDKLLEPGDGFYASRDWSVTALSVLSVLFIAAFMGLSYFTRNAKQAALRYSRKPVKSRATAIVSIALAVCLLWDVKVCVSFLLEHLDEVVLEINKSDANNLFTVLMKTGLLPRLLEAVTAFPAAIFALGFGIVHWRGKSSFTKRRLLQLFLPLWLVMRTIFRFTHTLSFLRVSELFYDLLVLAFLLVFFMAFTQLHSGVNENDNDWMLPAFGFPAALFALLCFVPRVLMIILGKSEDLTAPAPADPIDLTLALFVLSILRVRVRGRVIK